MNKWYRSCCWKEFKDDGIAVSYIHAEDFIWNVDIKPLCSWTMNYFQEYVRELHPVTVHVYDDLEVTLRFITQRDYTYSVYLEANTYDFFNYSCYAQSKEDVVRFMYEVWVMERSKNNKEKMVNSDDTMDN